MWLDLDYNEISDIDPLVENTGIDSGDEVDLLDNPLSSTSIDTYIPALQARGVTVYYDAESNQEPDQPSNDFPVDGATHVSLTTTLESSPFSDPDGDDHAASQWQITTSSDNYTSAVFDSSTDNTNLTSVTVPALSYSTTYYWHVRHQDDNGAWSQWSEETSFTTFPESTEWQAMTSGTTEYLLGVWGTSASDVFAVGDGGTILHYNGSAWSPMSSGTTDDLWEIWSTSASDIFVVGGNSDSLPYTYTILHYNGNEWSVTDSGSEG